MTFVRGVAHKMGGCASEFYSHHFLAMLRNTYMSWFCSLRGHQRMVQFYRRSRHGDPVLVISPRINRSMTSLCVQWATEKQHILY